MALTNVACTANVGLKHSFVTTGQGQTGIPSGLITDAQTTRFTGLGDDFTWTGTLAASATVDIDLSAAVPAFSTITAVIVQLTTLTGGLKVGGTGGSNINLLWFNAAADAILVEQSGIPFIVGSQAGKVVDGTHKTFRITNTSGAAVAGYKVVVVGT